MSSAEPASGLLPLALPTPVVDNFTLTLKVFDLVGGRYSIEWDIVMAATFLATVPVAIVFAFMQRYLIRGLALASVK